MRVLDWLVIAGYAVGMLAVGQYYATRNRTTDDYLLGGRRMSPFAIGLSLFATLTSALSYLAVPGEIIKHGPMQLAQYAVFPLIGIVVGWGLIPFIMRQKVTSAYEILEQRFGPSVRIVGATMFLFMRLVWMATILYATSDKVLAPMLGLGPQATILASVVMCLITLIYTAEGGIRAVVLTDAIQSLIMLGGAVLVIVLVTMDLGGISAWWPHQWAAHWDAPRFGFDTTTRITFLGMITSAFGWFVCTLGSDQMAIQRWLSTRDATAARRSLFTTLGSEALVGILLGLVGLALVGYFTAHPSLFTDSASLVSGADRLFPRFVMVGLPAGVTGVIIAAILAAAMSSLSSGMNSSSLVITEDFIVRFRKSPLTDASRMRLARWISVAIGTAVILISLLVSRIEGNLLDVCFRAVNLLTAPLFVLFFMAMFVRWATTFGTLIAALASVITAVSIAYAEAFGLATVSIMWILPGSFASGVVCGSIASLLPVGRPSKVIIPILLLAPVIALHAADPGPVEFTVKLETVMKHDDDKFHWFHPRAAAIQVAGQAEPAVVMTIQKHLIISDYYSGLHVMTRKSPDSPWTGPVLPPELDWRPQPDGVTVSVADVTPGWHAPTGKLIAIGCQVRYSPKGEQLDDVKRANQTVYAVFDPKTGSWTPWQVLELPPEDQFDFARNACAQWIVQPDGTLLVPLYIGLNSKVPASVTVAECRFDGARLSYVRHGNVLRLNVVRGLCEPSLIAFQGRYFLTLRNDIKGYVSVSDDGLHFAGQKPWLFDDGTELGSYNTQQHWLAHGDGLFLVYTRRGANNDHIVRHRAPLFMAQVNPETLQVMRRTEKIVVPERGAEMGNFGACAISESESWVTVSEGMFMKDSKQRGAEGATFVARILWAKPNKQP